MCKEYGGSTEAFLERISALECAESYALIHFIFFTCSFKFIVIDELVDIY